MNRRPVTPRSNGRAAARGDDALREAEDAVQASEARKGAILESALDSIITIDHLGNILEFNPAAERTFGYRCSDVLGEQLVELIVPPSLRAAHTRGLARWTARGPTGDAGRILGQRLELTALHADGKEFPIEISICRLDLPGPPIFTASIRDISDRKAAEEQLYAAEARYRTLVERLPLISYVDAPESPDLPPLYISPQLEAILGYSLAEWRSRPGLHEQALHPDDRMRVLEEKRRAYATGEPLQSEYRMYRADGALIWILDESILVRDGDGTSMFRQGFAIDITRRKRAEEALQNAENKYRTLIEQLPLVVYIDAIDEVSSNIYTSPQVEPLLGYSPDEWQANPLLFVELLHPEDRERVLAAHVRAHASGEGLSVEYRLFARDGHVVWVRDDARVLKDGEGNPTCLQGYLLDITAQKEAEDQLRHQAFHDSLTGLANRALLADRLEHALRRRDPGSLGAAVLFLDLDDFKTINDSLGHFAADEVLRAAGARIRRVIRQEDTVARLGGDEFAVLLESVRDPSEAAQAAGRVAEALSAPFEVADRELFITASIGIALGHDADELLRAADVAMYRVKARGKAHYAFYEPEMDEAVFSRLEVAADLRRANLRDELVLHYQPIVSLADGELVGLEALLRWRHPERGLIGPVDFISLAEETGLIVPIGRWVLSEACRQAARWQQELPLTPPLEICVNVSARQLHEPGFVRDVGIALASSGLAPGSLTLELTESVLMQSGEAGLTVLADLRRLGVALALDDFGTGYSSLSYLQRLPVQAVKIDRSFTAGIEDDAKNRALVGAIIELTHALGMDVIAEGIERDGQSEELRRLGCEIGQGFLFAEPCESAEIEQLLRTGSHERRRMFVAGGESG